MTNINRSQRAINNDFSKGFYPLEQSGRRMYFDLKRNN